jgi:uncharacterized protein
MAAYYLDTCVVISAFMKDANSERVLAWLGGQQDTLLHVSDWVITEAPSSLGRHIRKGEVSVEDGNMIWLRMQKWFDTDCQIMDLRTDDYKRAAKLLSNWSLGLRAGDALHLAACERFDFHLVTHDRKFSRIAEQNGIPVIQP